MNNITTIILVAGKSSRFKSNKSKIFNELGGLPIIHHIYNTAFKISKNNIIFVCNKQNINSLKKIFPKCKFSIQKKQNGTADAVLSAKNQIKKNSHLLILFGDSPLITIGSLRKLYINFKKNNFIGSMLAFKATNPSGYGRLITEGQYVKSIIEEIHADSEIRKIKLCNSGILLCSYNSIFSFINKIKNNNKKNEKYLTDLFQISYNNKKSFSFTICDEEEMLGVNTLHDFNKVDEIYQDQLKEKLISSGIKIYNPKTVRVSYDTKIGKNTILEPFVCIGTGVKIKNNALIKSHSILESSTIGNESSIGPFARIRPKSFIGSNVKIGNFVEIKNSKIGDNCSISHLSYIGDSQLGKKINIGAGTITCNFDGVKKNKTIIEDDVFIGSNTSLIAPVKIGKNSKTGAGSVIKKNIPPNSTVVGLDKLIKFKKIK